MDKGQCRLGLEVEGGTDALTLRLRNRGPGPTLPRPCPLQPYPGSARSAARTRRRRGAASSAWGRGGAGPGAGRPGGGPGEGAPRASLGRARPEVGRGTSRDPDQRALKSYVDGGSCVGEASKEVTVPPAMCTYIRGCPQWHSSGPSLWKPDARGLPYPTPPSLPGADHGHGNG